MYRVCVTGGIGSGKSVVCRFFKSLGLPVFTADIEANSVINTDGEVACRLTEKFGKDIYLYEGLIDRQKLASLMFGDKAALQFVNSVVHPVVMKKYNVWCMEQISPYLIFETAILFESGIRSCVDTVAAVSSPLQLRIQRTMARDRITEEEVMRKIKSQMDETEKQRLSDHVIINDDKQLLIPQVLKLHQLFLENAEKLS